MTLNLILLQTLSDVDYLNVNNIQHELVGSLGPLVRLGRMVAGLGSLLYLFTTIIDGMNENRYDWLATLRPFLLFFAITFYSSFLTMINVIIEPLNRAGDGMAQSQYTLYQTEYQKMMDSIKKYADGNDNIQPPPGWMEKMGNLGGELKLIIISFMYKSILMICWLIVNVLTFIILLIRSLYLAFLYVFGPIAIGLSAFPTFMDNWKTWLSKYISINLWYPIAQIIYYVCLKINTMAVAHINSIIQTRPDNIELTDFTLLLFSAVSAIIVLQTPTIAGMIINENTAGMMSKLVSQAATGGRAATNIGNSAANAASSAVGGVGSRLRNAWKKI